MTIPITFATSEGAGPENCATLVEMGILSKRVEKQQPSKKGGENFWCGAEGPFHDSALPQGDALALGRAGATKLVSVAHTNIYLLLPIPRILLSKL